MDTPPSALHASARGNRMEKTLIPLLLVSAMLPSPAPPPTGSSDQKARDADMRAILESELRKAEARHAELLKESSDGNPERNAIDLRNPQRRQERSDELKASVARSESDIAGIKREIARLPAAAD